MNIKEHPHTCRRMRIPRFRNDVAYNVGLGVIRVKPGISVNLHQRFFAAGGCAGVAEMLVTVGLLAV